MPLLKPPRLHGPVGKPIRRALGNPLPHPHILSQRAQLLRSHRLSNHQPPKCAAPTPEQPLVEREPHPPLAPRAAPVTTTLPAGSEQPVANSGDLPPARKLPDKPTKLLRRNRRPARAGRQRQHHVRGLVIRAANKRIPRDNDPNRPARGGPHPPKRDRPSLARGNPRVIRGHKRGQTLSATRIRGRPRRRVRASVLPPRNLPDHVSVKPQKVNLKAVKPGPAASHHDTSQPCPSPWVSPTVHY